VGYFQILQHNIDTLLPGAVQVLLLFSDDTNLCQPGSFLALAQMHADHEQWKASADPAYEKSA
jgi:hypothetical protein